MDLTETLREMRAQRDRLAAAIAALESLNNSDGVAPRAQRGRKSMSETEWREVSARMKRYWASRRKSGG